MPCSRYASNAKQLNQQLFLSLTDTLSVTQEFTSTIQLFSYQHSTLLNEIITTHAAVIGFKSFPILVLLYNVLFHDSEQSTIRFYQMTPINYSRFFK